MKKFTLSVVTVLSMSAFAVAGGDIAPVEPEVVVPAPEPVAVVDDSGFYLGVAYSRARDNGDYHDYTYNAGTEYDTYGTEKIDYNGIMAQAGYKFNKYVALEGRYWWSLGDGDWSYSERNYTNGQYVNSASGSGSNDGDKLRAWGVYLKPMYPVTDKADVYALLGYGGVKLSDDPSGTWLDEKDFQWGAGASYKLTDNLSLFVDYVRLLNNKDNSSSWTQNARYYGEDTWNDTVYTVNVGLTYKFYSF